MFRLAKVAIALLIATSSGSLLAANLDARQIGRSTTVHFGDLDLTRQADVAILYRRINFAADQVCGPKESPGSYIISAVYRRCFVTAVDRAIATLDRPELSAYHRLHRAASKWEQKVAQR